MAKQTIGDKMNSKQLEINKIEERIKELNKQKKKKMGELKLLKHEYLMEILEENNIDSSDKLLEVIQSDKSERKEKKRHKRPVRTTPSFDSHNHLDADSYMSDTSHFDTVESITNYGETV